MTIGPQPKLYLEPTACHSSYGVSRLLQVLPDDGADTRGSAAPLWQTSVSHIPATVNFATSRKETVRDTKDVPSLTEAQSRGPIVACATSATNEGVIRALATRHRTRSLVARSEK